METYTLAIYKNYSVERIPFYNRIYDDPVDWIAHLFYANVDCTTDNILIKIYGDFHQTFPNPPHLRITFTYNGITTAYFHISVDENGIGYTQPISQTGHAAKNILIKKQHQGKKITRKRKRKNK